ncbi:hypothetical protein CEXT_37801, partial [Caerostris extrusa]
NSVPTGAFPSNKLTLSPPPPPAFRKRSYGLVYPRWHPPTNLVLSHSALRGTASFLY